MFLSTTILEMADEIQVQLASSSQVLEFLLGAGLDRAQASSCKARGLKDRRTGRAVSLPLNYTQVPRVARVLPTGVSSSAWSWRPCSASAKGWIPLPTKSNGGMNKVTAQRQSHQAPRVRPRLCGWIDRLTNLWTLCQCPSGIRMRNPPRLRVRH